MRAYMMSRSSVTINNLWKARGRRPTLRRTCKVFIPRDLRQLDTLRVPPCYEEDHFLVQKLKAVTRHKLHHWILIAAISCYLYLGAIMFQYIEAHYGKVTPFNMSQPREAFLDAITKDSRSLVEDKEKWLKNARQTLITYEAKILEAGKLGYKQDVSRGMRPHWRLEEAILYCLTVVTTVGYGNIAPSTDAGRAATIVYAFLGIPLMLMVLADLGKLFTKANKYIFRYVLRFYKSGTCSKTKAAAMANNKKPLQYMTVSWRTVSRDLNSETKKDGTSGCNQVTTLTLHNDDLYKDLDFMNADEANHKHVEVEDEFNLPVSLAIALVLVYMVVGALLFAVWEQWTFFESFYFVFISMSTVGFGDYVPSNQTYMMGAFAYLVLGLTLTSMCINVIQEKLSATFQKAKVRIGNTIGLDVNTLLSDENQRPKSPKSDQISLRNVKSYGSKTSLHKDSIASRPSTPIFDQSHKPIPSSETTNPRDDVLLHVPLQKRFTFYDSPYSTIQNDSLYNTVHSIT